MILCKVLPYKIYHLEMDAYMGWGWDGIDCWYWCRHRSKDCKKAHHLPSQASTFWVGRVIPMNNLHHGHVCTDEFTQTGATITYYNIQVLQRR